MTEATGLSRSQLNDQRKEQMRGRCNTKTAGEWASLLGCKATIARRIANSLGEKCKAVTFQPDLYWDEVDNIKAKDKVVLEWARKPWGNYDRMRKQWRDYWEAGYASYTPSIL